MAEHPIENLMVTAMSSLRDMIDVNTILGDTVETKDGTTIIPVSKVCFGFAAGGSEFNTNKLNKYAETIKLPFGGGSGAGVKISPIAFLIVKENNVKLLSVEADKPIDKLVEYIPDAINKLTGVIDKALEKPSSKINIENEDI